MMQDQYTKIMRNLDGYIIEGDKRYAFHPEKGCEQAPSFYLQDAINIMGNQKATQADLLGALKLVRGFVEASSESEYAESTLEIVDEAIQKARES